jgi:hypothetical protein
MKKIIKVIIFILTSWVLAAGVYLLVMYQLGDRILDEVIDQQLAQLELIEQQLQQSEQIEEIEQQQSQVPLNSSADSTHVKKPQYNKSDTQKSNVTNTSDKDKGQTSYSTAESSSSDASMEPSVVNTNTKTEVNKNMEISREKLDDVKDKITASDKVAIAYLVMKKLKQEDIKELTAMAAGGLTPEEKKRAKAIAYSRFSKDEINIIMELYTKYMK